MNFLNFWKSFFLPIRLYSGGGSGGGGSGNTTVQNSNIPEYARPYVETMLGTAEQQIYNYGPGVPGKAATYDAEGNELTPAVAATDKTVTGFKPYVPYGATVDANGNITNTAQEQASAVVAGFSPLQQQVFQNAGQMRLPGQYAYGSNLVGTAGYGALGTAGKSGSLMNEALGYGQAGSQYGGVGQMYGAQGAQQANQAAQQAARQANMYGRQSANVGMQGLGYGAQGARYGAAASSMAPYAKQYGQNMADIGSMGGAQASALGQNVANQATGYGAQSAQAGNLGLSAGQNMANIGNQGMGYGAMGSGYGQQAADMSAMGFNAGQNFANQATNPNATAAYMSPYMQNVVDYQKSEAQRDFDVGQQSRKAQAVGAGAFGGSRQAIADSEAQRNLSKQLQGISAAGSQEAFKNAQAQQQFGANLGLQGLGAGYQGLNAGMQGAQTGLQGLGTALQGQQGSLAGLSAYQQGLQGAQQGLGTALSAGNLGLAGGQQALAGQQGALSGLNQAGNLYGLGMQGAQSGMSGVNSALQGFQGAQSGVGQQINAGQLGLQGTAQGIQGTQVGMQGAQAGMQGVQGAVGAGQYGLQGLSQATQSGQALANIGGQELAGLQSIYGLQSQLGGQQQQLEQNKVNQSIQNYAMQQQYPMQQLSAMSSLLRGLPLQAATTQSYQAAPSAISQLSGLGLTAAAGYGMMKAEGGVIKSYAEGGAIEDETENFVSGGIAQSITNKVRMNPEGYSKTAIDKSTKNGLVDDIVGLAAIQEKNKQEKERQAQIAATQGTPPTIKDQILAERDALEQQRQQGIEMAQSNLPTEYAGGGIIAFEEGGSVMQDIKDYYEKMKGKIDPASSNAMSIPESVKAPFGIPFFGAANKDVVEKNLTTAPTDAPAAPVKPDTGIRFLPDAPATNPASKLETLTGSPAQKTDMGASGIDDIIKQSIGDLKANAENSKDARKEAKLMAMLQAGLGIMGGTSQYAAVNAKGALPALQGYQEEMRGIRSDESKQIAQIAALNLKGAELKQELNKLGITKEHYDSQNIKNIAYAKYLSGKGSGGAALYGGAIPPATAQKVNAEYKTYAADPRSAPFFSSLPKDVQIGLTKYKPGTESYNRSLQLFNQFSRNEMAKELQMYSQLNRRSGAQTTIDDLQ